MPERQPMHLRGTTSHARLARSLGWPAGETRRPAGEPPAATRAIVPLVVTVARPNGARGMHRAHRSLREARDTGDF